MRINCNFLNEKKSIFARKNLNKHGLGVLISLMSLSNALDLSAIDQLPLCEGGHITAKSGGISENNLPSSACRWLIDNEQEGNIKLTLHELTRDCVDSEDEIYLLDGERSIFGPFCAPAEQRYRRETFSKDVNFDYEVPKALSSMFSNHYIIHDVFLYNTLFRSTCQVLTT